MTLDTYRRRALFAAAVATTAMSAVIAPTRVWLLGGRTDVEPIAVMAGWALFTGASLATLIMLHASYQRAIRVYLGAIVLVIMVFVQFETPNIAVICLLLGLVFVQQTAIAMDEVAAGGFWTVLTTVLYAPLLLARMTHDPIQLFATPIELLVGTAGPTMALLCLGTIGTLTRRTLTELNHELQQARDTALAANRAKSAFLATMSHELRTPLNAIIGYAELIEDDVTDGFTDDLGSDVGRIHTSARHLLGLVDQVLDLSRIESGDLEIHLAATDFASTLAEACDSVRPQLATNRNELRVVNELETGEGTTDPTRLREVLVILLSNAAQFTQDGLVEVTLRESQRAEQRSLSIQVRDTGVGIPPDQLDRILHPFTQVDESHTREHDGAGLSLGIASQLCELMGGKMLVESELGRGSTFTVCLPFRTA